MRRNRCAGGCGRAARGLCATCTARLPSDLRMALGDSEDQYGIDDAARRWLRTHPEETR